MTSFFSIMAVLFLGSLLVWLIYLEKKLSRVFGKHQSSNAIHITYSKFPDTIILELLAENYKIDGMPIELEAVTWDTIFQKMSDHTALTSSEHSISFANKKASMAATSNNLDVNFIQDDTDLVKYKGFAILYWPEKADVKPYKAFANDSKLTEVMKIRAVLSQLDGKQIYASGETDHARDIKRLTRAHSFSPKLKNEHTPEECFQAFFKDKSTFFVGGAQHRYIAELVGARALIAQDEIDLGLKASNCFSFSHSQTNRTHSVVDELSFLWEKIAQRVDDGNGMHVAFKDKMQELLNETAESVGYTDDIDVDHAYVNMWKKWFTVKGGKAVIEDKQTSEDTSNKVINMSGFRKRKVNEK